ncbi:hypothetical protein HMPREF9999_01568 [Alloprevotella sp. oral taxon 473 str. F0040]|nr:hypothetical protein HMPREF9999_01568 [Alloprevotella sp. oral taxon 473 str. F0040]
MGDFSKQLGDNHLIDWRILAYSLKIMAIKATFVTKFSTHLLYLVL